MNSTAESHSKPHCERDDPDGIEVTAEMVRAGVDELEIRFIDLRRPSQTGIFEEAVRAIFLAMTQANLKSRHEAQ